MSAITLRNMDMLSASDLSSLIDRADVRFEPQLETLHRNIRQWTDKGLIYSWGRAGQGKTSTRLYDFNQVYRAAFMSVCSGVFAAPSFRRQFYLHCFDGAIAPDTENGEPEPVNEYTDGRGAVRKIADGLGCIFVQAFLGKSRGFDPWEVAFRAHEHPGPIGELIAEHWPNVDSLTALDISVIVRPILALDPRYRAVGDHDLPRTTEPPIDDLPDWATGAQ